MNLVSLFSGCGGMDIGFEGDFFCLKKSINLFVHPEWVEIEKNRHRDYEVNQTLCFMGWTVLRFWGKEILSQTDECVRVIEETIFEIKLAEFDNSYETEE